MNLKYVSKNDKEWRAYVFSICKDKDITHEVVQEMYIKISDVKKPIDKFYILATLRNTYYNYSRKNQNKKEIKLVNEIHAEANSNIYELDDQEIEILEKFNNQKWYRRILIEESYYKSIRKIADEYNINYGFVFREITKAKNEILQNNETV